MLEKKACAATVADSNKRMDSGDIERWQWRKKKIRSKVKLEEFQAWKFTVGAQKQIVISVKEVLKNKFSFYFFYILFFFSSSTSFFILHDISIAYSHANLYEIGEKFYT